MSLLNYIVENKIHVKDILNYFNAIQTSRPFKNNSINIYKDYINNEDLIQEFINDSDFFYFKQSKIDDYEDEESDEVITIEHFEDVYETINTFLEYKTVGGETGLYIQREINFIDVSKYENKKEGIGIYWAFDDPESYFDANDDKNSVYHVHAIVDINNIDWKTQLILLGKSTVAQDFEQEIRLKKDIPVIVFGLSKPDEKIIKINPKKIYT